jgi:tripartite-type tricarboxylate transporter receptor subunit TctC
MRRFGVALFTLALVGGVGMTTALAADYPEKPITFTITWKPGGAGDISGRMAAKAAEAVLGQPIKVINKLGGGGSIGFDYVGQQKPDGYNIGWLSASILTTTLLGTLPYAYDENFEYVCGVTFDATAIAVRADSPHETLDDLVAAMKAKPGQVKVGTGGSGSFTYMLAAALTDKVGAKATLVPLGQRRLPGLLSGEVDALSVHPPGMMSALKSGKVRFLAISSPKRIDAYKDVPTLSELGLGLGMTQFRGIFVPKGTPEAVKIALDKAFAAAENDPKLVETANARGFGINYIPYKDFPAYVTKQNDVLKAVAAKLK